MPTPLRSVNSPPCRTLAVTTGLTGAAGEAQAHAASSGFVLLLPTDIYIGAGVLTVALTLAVVLLLPPAALDRLFRARTFGALSDPAAAQTVVSLLSLGLLGGLVAAGYIGPNDPLSNPLTLGIWTIFWIVLVSAQGLLGDLWAWLSPWRGFARLVQRAGAPPLRLPDVLGQGPAVAVFLLAMSFALADPAPDSPPRLAGFVLGYGLFTAAGLILFGRAWLAQVECFTVLMRWFALLAPVQVRGRLALGLPGWAAVAAPVPGLTGAVFVIVLLGTGSFDGLNETFWWFAQIGINPLAFPGRSAIVWQTTLGLLGANLLLIGAVWGCCALGHLMARAFAPGPTLPPIGPVFCRLSVSLLPIALGYHIAHYFTTFLVNGQYALVALSDPLATGADLLNLGTFYVSTGFFNTRDTVEIIFRVQAGAIVIAHVFGVLMAHRIAQEVFSTRRATLLGQMPLALFMVLYTLLGLWLLAAPRGA